MVLRNILSTIAGSFVASSGSSYKPSAGGASSGSTRSMAAGGSVVAATDADTSGKSAGGWGGDTISVSNQSQQLHRQIFDGKGGGGGDSEDGVYNEAADFCACTSIAAAGSGSAKLLPRPRSWNSLSNSSVNGTETNTANVHSSSSSSNNNTADSEYRLEILMPMDISRCHPDEFPPLIGTTTCASAVASAAGGGGGGPAPGTLQHQIKGIIKQLSPIPSFRRSFSKNLSRENSISSHVSAEHPSASGGLNPSKKPLTPTRRRSFVGLSTGSGGNGDNGGKCVEKEEQEVYATVTAEVLRRRSMPTVVVGAEFELSGADAAGENSMDRDLSGADRMGGVVVDAKNRFKPTNNNNNLSAHTILTCSSPASCCGRGGGAGDSQQIARKKGGVHFRNIFSELSSFVASKVFSISSSSSSSRRYDVQVVATAAD
mmetsp:Transcript_30211/g.51083  ORF Transcript_30211/g.51083 Transcript_30211/m.51083 type:complete len:430 (+) Transcript_30211:1925-3214(+)